MIATHKEILAKATEYANKFPGWGATLKVKEGGHTNHNFTFKSGIRTQGSLIIEHPNLWVPTVFNYSLPVSEIDLAKIIKDTAQICGYQNSRTAVTKQVIIIHPPSPDKPYHWEEKRTITEYV